MLVCWLGSLAFLLNQFWRSVIRPIKEPFNANNQKTRIGVYYMCIDDLPI